MSPTAYETRLRMRAQRSESWGFLLLGISAALWLWFAVLLLLPYDANGTSCEPRLFTDGPTANGRASFRNPCSAERDWPQMLGVLGLSVPLSVAGAILHTSGRIGMQLSTLSTHAADAARRTESTGSDTP
ncbi:hypothetical protein AB0M39_32310 [Streptomyces sp. NPDC051907]|uniref:hypothetical protein n=1 Tax=Streptomyces sp. NPDC051907 TaxID=3155284 RepID=UPI003447979E